MRKKLILFMMIMSALFMVACQSKDQPQNEEKVAAEPKEEQADFPVTIESTDKAVEIKKKPEHILPLSLDVTEIVLELVDPSKVVAISKSVEDEQLSTQVDKAAEIKERVSSAVHIDPEEILSFNTDLLLLTKMHGQEEDANQVLSTLDLPIITFNTMGTVDAFLENVATIGQAVGEMDKANALIDQMRTEIEAIQANIPEQAEKPSVLVLSEVGPGTGPFMMGPGNISYDLIKLAGAEPAVNNIDLESSTPASIEQILKMDPDYIFLLDFVGDGDKVFTDLMKSPGWDNIEAVKNDQTMVLAAKYLMNPNVENVEGLERLVRFIYKLEE